MRSFCLNLLGLSRRSLEVWVGKFTVIEFIDVEVGHSDDAKECFLRIDYALVAISEDKVLDYNDHACATCGRGIGNFSHVEVAIGI